MKPTTQILAALSFLVALLAAAPVAIACKSAPSPAPAPGPVPRDYV